MHLRFWARDTFLRSVRKKAQFWEGENEFQVEQDQCEVIAMQMAASYVLTETSKVTSISRFQTFWGPLIPCSLLLGTAIFQNNHLM